MIASNSFLYFKYSICTLERKAAVQHCSSKSQSFLNQVFVSLRTYRLKWIATLIVKASLYLLLKTVIENKILKPSLIKHYFIKCYDGFEGIKRVTNR